ncbi:MAG: biotin/lipoyl-binding protein, partial [Pseudomonadota bacterium]
MLELLATSFPVIIRYFQLKRRGEAISAWNMKTAVFLWLSMAFALFLTIFYFHPKSYSGLVPFRTISVVAQTSGPVTELDVANGQRVSAGDLLFRIEDNTQKAALAQAQAELDSIAAEEEKAQEALQLAQATVVEAETSLAQFRVDLENAEILLSRDVGPEDRVRELRSSVRIAEAKLDAANVQVDIAETDIADTLPAKRQVATAALESAGVELAKTEVRSFSDGVVTQLAMGVGSPASRFIASPAMIIIPDRTPETPRRLVAGFSQVSRDVLYEGMPAEVACESNASIGFTNAVFPARVASIQPAIASGQINPGGRLLDPDSVRRGSVLVYVDPIFPEHRDLLLDGSGCIVQTY